MAVEKRFHQHTRPDCKGGKIELRKNGIYCRYCKIMIYTEKIVPSKTGNKRKTDLLAFLADEHKRYQAEIASLHPDNSTSDNLSDLDNDEIDGCYEKYDAEKNEFLESLWDGIQQHFDDQNGGQERCERKDCN